jgi:MSHA biogenesis protein MshJ
MKLKDEQRKFVPPEKIGALLEELLSRNRRLQLVDMRTLAAVALDPSAPAPKPSAEKPAADKPPARPAVPAAGTIYRHGVEITLSGSYLDLLAYLTDLEKLPSQMYWGKLDLAVAAYPKVTLKLSVYTMSLDLAWLIV